MAKYKTRQIVLPVELDGIVREIARRENLSITKTLELLVRTGIEAYIRENPDKLSPSPTGGGRGKSGRGEVEGKRLTVRDLLENSGEWSFWVVDY